MRRVWILDWIGLGGVVVHMYDDMYAVGPKKILGRCREIVVC